MSHYVRSRKGSRTTDLVDKTTIERRGEKKRGTGKLSF